MTREYVRLTKIFDRSRRTFSIYEIEGWLLEKESIGKPLRIQAELINRQKVDREFITDELTQFSFLNMGHFFVKTAKSQYQLEYVVRNRLLGDENNEGKRVSDSSNENKPTS